MPRNYPGSNANQATSRSKPYTKGSKSSQRKSWRASSPLGQSNPNPEPVYPPLLPGQDSVLDLMRNMIKKNFPFFVPRNTLDIVTMSSVDNNALGWANDHRAIWAFIDAKTSESQTTLMLSHKCSAEEVLAAASKRLDDMYSRMPATDVMGTKPRAGQPALIRALPSCPEYSIRLWVACFPMFGMDFIESATDEPIDLSHRFRVYCTFDMFNFNPDTAAHMRPQTCNEPPGPGEEIYYVHEHMEVVVRDSDMFQTPAAEASANATLRGEVGEAQQKTDEPVTRLVKFKVPKHPWVAVPKSLPLTPVMYDELHFD